MRGLLFTLLYLLCANVLAQAPAAPPPLLINWVSQDSSQEVTIQNGTAAALTVQINVIDNVSSDAPGINIKNCGTTTHADAGTTVICRTNDPHNPITFSSDSPTVQATGTYQITSK